MVSNYSSKTYERFDLHYGWTVAFGDYLKESNGKLFFFFYFTKVYALSLSIKSGYFFLGSMRHLVNVLTSSKNYFSFLMVLISFCKYSTFRSVISLFFSEPSDNLNSFGFCGCLIDSMTLSDGFTFDLHYNLIQLKKVCYFLLF